MRPTKTEMTIAKIIREVEVTTTMKMMTMKVIVDRAVRIQEKVSEISFGALDFKMIETGNGEFKEDVPLFS